MWREKKRIDSGECGLAKVGGEGTKKKWEVLVRERRCWVGREKRASLGRLG